MKAMMRVLSVLFGLLMLSAGAFGQKGYFPVRVTEWAEARGCAAITEWYGDATTFDPPYAFGWLPGDREKSAAYWCVSKGDPKKVRLIFEGESDCPKELEWHGSILGLSIVDESITLDKFVYWGDPNQGKGLRRVVTRGPFLYAGYSGAGFYFYCYRDKWLVSPVNIEPVKAP